MERKEKNEDYMGDNIYSTTTFELYDLHKEVLEEALNLKLTWTKGFYNEWHLEYRDFSFVMYPF